MRPPKSLTGEALAFWKRNAKPLIDAGVLTPIDRDAFVMLCICWAKLRSAEVAESDGIKFVCLSKQVQSLLKAFALTPESRKRMKIAPPEPVEEDDGLI